MIAYRRKFCWLIVAIYIIIIIIIIVWVVYNIQIGMKWNSYYIDYKQIYIQVVDWAQKPTSARRRFRWCLCVDAAYITHTHTERVCF